jgi:predicted dehydrogenase
MNMNRRNFLKGAAVASAPFILPSHIWSAEVKPNDRPGVGFIGMGKQMGGLLSNFLHQDVQCLAVCDVDTTRRDAAKKKVDDYYAQNPGKGAAGCQAYIDFRDIIARKDIDMVCIATPDHWHTVQCVAALRAGKDVYCEKPGSISLALGREVVQAAQRYGRVFQTGTQRLSEANFTVANELLRLGRLGEVRTVRAHIARGAATMNREWLPAEPEPAREELDWNAWLGPAPWRPYNKSYVHGGWHGQYDFHTSCIGEWGSHTFAQCQVALGLGETCPVLYPYVGNDSGVGMATRFANGVEMVLDRSSWHGSCGVRYEGSEGWVACADGYSRPEVSRPSLLADYAKLLQDYLSRTGRRMGHMRNFLDCVRTRQQPVANAVVMHRSMTTVHAANIAMWLKRDVRFDPVKEEFVNDPEANRLRVRASRQPWLV